MFYIFKMDSTIIDFNMNYHKVIILPNRKEKLTRLVLNKQKVCIANIHEVEPEYKALTNKLNRLNNMLNLDIVIHNYFFDISDIEKYSNVLQKLLTIYKEFDNVLFVGSCAVDQHAANKAGIQFIYASEFFK